jgi:hypothetical protein
MMPPAANSLIVCTKQSQASFSLTPITGWCLIQPAPTQF